VATIELRGVDKIYDGDVHAVRNLDLDVEDGELLVLLGPSGCGKSTVLRLVAGLESLSEGEIRVGGRRVDEEPGHRRDIAMVFQSYALYGHMTVRQNLEFPLRMRRVPREERRRRAEEIAGLLELSEHLDVRPGALSGGQQQRVAMGRALVREPRAFLLDEPLSNLDARLRAQVRAHIAALQLRLGVTTVYVTHDQVEALSLGHRVAILRAGRLQQLGPGQELYDRPANVFVAQFLGQPGMNLLRSHVREGLGGHPWEGTAHPWDGAAHADEGVARADERPARADERPVIVGIRPESLELTDEDGPHTLGAEVHAVEALGAERLVYLAAPVTTVDATAEAGGSGKAGEGGPLLAVRTGTSRAVPRMGDRVRLKASTRGIHVFEADGTAASG